MADGKIVREEVVDTNGSGHGALAGFLMQRGVDTLICGGIGGGAQMALAEAGIKLYGGVSGEADAAVNALLASALAYDPNVRCDHHDHAHGEGGHLRRAWLRPSQLPLIWRIGWCSFRVGRI